MQVEREYQSLSVRIASLAEARARNADVRGVQRLIDEVRSRDAELGTARPDAIGALLATVEVQLDAARRLRLARDRWALRQPAVQRYRNSVSGAVTRLIALRGALEDIKSLAGSTPEALDGLQRAAELLSRTVTLVEPPDEFRDAHALLSSAARMALNAATIRREATLAGDIARAWDASSAAAGALMLTARVQLELASASRAPQLPR
jgi:hypothetical protein